MKRRFKHFLLFSVVTAETSVAFNKMKQSSTPTTPATTRNQHCKRVLTNGIAQFPVWIDVKETIDPLSDVAYKRRIVINDGIADLSGMPALMSDSDDSETDEPIDLLNDDGVSSTDRGAVSKTAQKYVLRGEKLTSVYDDEHLGNAVPPLTEQVSHIETAHGSSTSSGSSGSCDGSLSDDFIDKNDLSLTHLQATTLMRFFPIMCQNMIENGI